ncbi:MAG: 7-carboxy-7-deazaguanine synthase QueE [Betaproteobacteria bacterium]|nr:7-carboxy-7-deazaguanine synthase QueE [Betaproteobacteria bacterium]
MSETQTYLVNEIYPCLQGEGPHLGKPSVLVRLQICNLRCTWCDTPYTHTLRSDPVDKNEPAGKQKFKRITNDELIAEIKAHARIKHVILSGGEPTLQNLAPLASALSDTHTIEVESNGTQIPHAAHHSFKREHYALMDWNISPKGKNAGQPLNIDALRHWAALGSEKVSVNFKFVIRKKESAQDLDEVETLIRDAGIDSARVILMAEGTRTEDHLTNTWLEEICLSKGWRMTTRLHVLTHGNLRGV